MVCLLVFSSPQTRSTGCLASRNSRRGKKLLLSLKSCSSSPKSSRSRKKRSRQTTSTKMKMATRMAMASLTMPTNLKTMSLKTNSTTLPSSQSKVTKSLTKMTTPMPPSLPPLVLAKKLLPSRMKRQALKWVATKVVGLTLQPSKQSSLRQTRIYATTSTVKCIRTSMARFTTGLCPRHRATSSLITRPCSPTSDVRLSLAMKYLSGEWRCWRSMQKNIRMSAKNAERSSSGTGTTRTRKQST